MALKYRLEYKDIKQNSWKFEIDSPTYTGTPIQLKGTAPDTISITWGNNSQDDPHSEHIIPSTATVSVYSDGLDIDELLNISTDQFRTRIHLNGVFYWSGYLLSDGVQRSRQSVSYPVKLTAICGLAKLDSITLIDGVDLYGAVTINGVEGSKYSPLNHIRVILQSTLILNNPLPIRWMAGNKSNQYPNDDAIAGRNEIDRNGELIKSGKSFFWWLESLVKSQYCWIRQYNGYWYIYDNKELIKNNGVFKGWEIPDTRDSIVAIPHVEDLNVSINYNLADNGYFILKKSFSTIITEYEDTTVKNNVIPNGGFDILEGVRPLYWSMKSGLNDKISGQVPINAEYIGRSCQVDNYSSQEDWLTFGSIPLDSNVLFKNANIGLIFSPVSGYSVNSQGYINDNQLRMRVKYTGYHQGQLKNLYLNENGYWQGFNIIVGGIAIGQLIFDINYMDVELSGENSEIGQTYNVSFTYEDGAGIDVLNMSYTFTQVLPLATAIQTIADNTGGAVVNGRIRYAYFGIRNERVSMSGSEDRPTNINFINLNVKLSEVVSIQFRSTGSEGNIKLADCGDLINALDAGAGMLSVEVSSRANSVMQLDDMYFTVSDNHDVYTITNNGKGSKGEYNLNISSSFNGHMISSYMNNYQTANQSMLWNNGITLTEQYGRNALDWLNKPNSIFSGTIPKMISPISYIELDGLHYIPLTTTINTHNNHTQLTLFEAKMNSENYTVTRKSSSDK